MKVNPESPNGRALWDHWFWCPEHYLVYSRKRLKIQSFYYIEPKETCHPVDLQLLQLPYQLKVRDKKRVNGLEKWKFKLEGDMGA